ncbi:MAG: hypothetical protein J6X18_12470 [Bacteroidales bacterium]|nr:hypothetical protein [Bacteroidales bacterium]
MFNDICDLVFKLYLYADMTKMIHYSTESNHCHELCDTVRDSINEFADSLAEQYFGYHGKPSFSDLTVKHDVSEIDDLGMLCKTVAGMTDELRKQIESDSKLQNLVSLIDDFKGDMEKDMFLATFDKVSNAKGN